MVISGKLEHFLLFHTTRRHQSDGNREPQQANFEETYGMEHIMQKVGKLFINLANQSWILGCYKHKVVKFCYVLNHLERYLVECSTWNISPIYNSRSKGRRPDRGGVQKLCVAKMA